MEKQILNKITELEKSLTSRFHTESNNWWYNIFMIFTEIGSTLGVIVIFIILIPFAGKDVFIVFLPIYLLQLIVVETIKLFFKRPRPIPQNGHKKNLFGFQTKSGSFPSGHTSNAFTLAFLISNYFNVPIWAAIFLYLIATLVGISRLFLGKHYIIDVIGGAIIGLTLSYVAWQIYY